MSTSATAPLVIFTPSAMAPDVLEAIFVQREALAERIVSSIKDSTKTATKHHWLLVGQRGMGKTHLVALVYHRLQATRGLNKKLRIAWLREESWEVTSYLDLLEVILQAIAQELTGAEGSLLRERTDALLDIEGSRAERDAEALILDVIGARTLLLVIENLDEVLKGIGTDGQRSLRAFMETNERFAVLATTPALFDGVSRQTSPFYGYFTVEHLEELNFEEARELLCRVADLRGEPEIAAFLRTPTGEARLRVVAELAGGHPRIWILFATCLSIELIDELVPLFIKMLDDLTPYYQERMRALSPQQRRIVTHLASFGGAQPVKDIARACRLSQPSTAKIIGDLEGKGFLRKAAELDIPTMGDRRLAMYELREPLMRLCLDIKESRGRPLRLIVQLLREWYGPRLFTILHEVAVGSLAETYVREALNHLVRTAPREELLSTKTEMITVIGIGLLTTTLRAFVTQLDPDEPKLPGYVIEGPRYFDRVEFERWVGTVVEAATREGWMTELAAGLTAAAMPIANEAFLLELWGHLGHSDSDLREDEAVQEAMGLWVDVWGLQQPPELEAPVSILRAAVAFRLDRNRAALTALPVERRRILERMIVATRAQVALDEGR